MKRLLVEIAGGDRIVLMKRGRFTELTQHHHKPITLYKTKESSEAIE